MSVKFTQEHKTFLENLRDSGVVNIWTATPYIVNAFGIKYSDAREILLTWINSVK